jgi:membrane-bound ClpP family serine protease
MTVLGLLLLLMGAALVVAEAHVPGGVLGVSGGVALVVGGILLFAASGTGAALAVPVVVGLGAAAGGFTLVAATKAAGVRRERIQAGAETLRGRIGVIRRWSEPAGQVFVEGALWRARRDWSADDGDNDNLHEGDQVVVERVSGLTLCVRPAEEWELL